MGTLEAARWSVAPLRGSGAACTTPRAHRCLRARTTMQTARVAAVAPSSANGLLESAAAAAGSGACSGGGTCCSAAEATACAGSVSAGACCPPSRAQGLPAGAGGCRSCVSDGGGLGGSATSSRGASARSRCSATAAAPAGSTSSGSRCQGVPGGSAEGRASRRSTCGGGGATQTGWARRATATAAVLPLAAMSMRLPCRA